MIVNTYCALFPPIPLCIRLDKGLQRYTIFKNFSSLIDLFLDTFQCFTVIRSGATSVLLVKKKHLHVVVFCIYARSLKDQARQSKYPRT